MASKSKTIVNRSVSGELMLQIPLIRADEEEDTVANAVDYKNRPVVRSKTGRWRSAAFIIGVEMAERIAYYGISGNLINFLTGKLGQSTATAAANVNVWSGVACLLPIVGALIADSFLGKYYTIIASSIIYTLGLGSLTLSAVLPFRDCLSHERNIKGTSRCSPTSLHAIVFFAALYLVALGQGGHKPCVQAFGADQFDGEDPREMKEKSSFFNWWYFGVCVGALVGTAIISYIQDNLSWGLGFGIPCIIMAIGLMIFLLGTMTYRFITRSEGRGPLKRFRRVLRLAFRNWRVKRSVPDDDEALGSQHRRGSQQFRFLDKALLTPKNLEGVRKACSKSEVEEAKSVLRLFPIWATCLFFAIVFAQPSTFFTKQGVTLDRSIGSSFAIPAAALQSFTNICILICLPVYDLMLVPVVRILTGRPAGISMLQRIGTGLFMSVICMVVAAVIEIKRLTIASQHGLIDLPDVTVPMSIWWLLPQYALFGIAEAFTMVGLQEFFYDQVPKELRSVGMSLYLSVFGIGSLLSSCLVSLINTTTSRGGAQSWFADNMNRAHLDYFYLLLAALSALGFSLFMYVANSYVYNKNKAHV